jgi:hypothetical protein
LAAISKDERVRVEASVKMKATVRPLRRSVGGEDLNEAAKSRMVSISEALSPSRPSRSFFSQSFCARVSSDEVRRND